MAEYVVELERDEDGRAWLARVPSVPGCHTYGRSITQALNRTREALALWIPKAAAARAELVPSIHLPGVAKAELSQLAAAREKAQRAQEDASDLLARAVRDLTLSEGWSVRDVARVVELSPQRVQQVSAMLAQTAPEAHGHRRVAASKKTAARKAVAAKKASGKRRGKR